MLLDGKKFKYEHQSKYSYFSHNYFFDENNFIYGGIDPAAGCGFAGFVKGELFSHEIKKPGCKVDVFYDSKSKDIYFYVNDAGFVKVSLFRNGKIEEIFGVKYLLNLNFKGFLKSNNNYFSTVVSIDPVLNTTLYKFDEKGGVVSRKSIGSYDGQFLMINDQLVLSGVDASGNDVLSFYDKNLNMSKNILIGKSGGWGMKPRLVSDGNLLISFGGRDGRCTLDIYNVKNDSLRKIDCSDGFYGLPIHPFEVGKVPGGYAIYGYGNFKKGNNISSDNFIYGNYLMELMK